MAYEHLLVEKMDGGVGMVTLNRPEVLNALNSALLSEYDEALIALDEDPEVRCLVVTGAGEKAFSSGADIKEAANRDGEGRSPLLRTWERANLKKPTIGAINGLAFGAGAMLAVELDIRIGCERSQFRFPQAFFGWVGGTWTLPLVVGWPRAKELLFSARVVEPEEAVQIGLLNRLVPGDGLLDSALELGRQIAKNKPQAVMAMKRLMSEHIGRSWPGMLQAERDFQAETAERPVAKEAFQDLLSRKRSSGRSSN